MAKSKEESRKILEENREKIIELFTLGISYEEISFQIGFGIAYHPVIDFCKELGLSRKRRYGPRVSGKVRSNCIGCGIEIKRIGNFHSNDCERKYKIKRWISKEFIPVGKYGQILQWMRDYIVSLKGNNCWKCGWSEVNPKSMKVPLEINHIDGNCMNNSIENLELICPNCHSLTPNFRRLNESSKRKYKIVFY